MNARNTKRAIGPLSAGLSAYTDDVAFTDFGGDAELKFSYERDGSLHAGALRFHHVRAYRFRNEHYCTVWHIEGAYDTLVEVEQSDWIDELVATEQGGWAWRVRHFLIFIDGAGAYEIAAADHESLPKQGPSPETGQPVST